MNFIVAMSKTVSVLWVAGAILLSLAGVALFAVLFLRDLNLFYFILAPVIFAFYQTPAYLLFRFWKSRKRRDLEAALKKPSSE